MKTVRLVAAMLSAFAIGAWATDNCTDLVKTETKTLDKYTEWAEFGFSSARYEGTKELCDIRLIDPPHGTTYCGQNIIFHRNFICNSAECSRNIKMIRDGVACGTLWGPDDEYWWESPSAASYKIAYFYKPITNATLNVSVFGTGTAKIDGQAITSKTIVVGKDPAIQVQASEIAGSGYGFWKWELKIGAAWYQYSLDLAPYVNLTAAGTTELRAVFILKNYSVKILANPTTSGTTNPVNGTAMSAQHGLTLNPKPTATAGSGFNFSRWSVTKGAANVAIPDPTNSTLTATITGDAEISALFYPQEYHIGFGVIGGGHTNWANDGFVLPINVWTEIKATPDPGWVFDHWEKCSDPKFSIESTGPETRFKSTGTTLACGAGNNAFLKAVFVHQTVSLSILLGEGGTSNPSGTFNVKALEPIAIVAYPASQYRFVKWTILGGTISMNTATASTSATLTTEATIQPLFEKLYPVYLEAGPGGSIATASPQWRALGERFQVSALNNAGYIWGSWANPQGHVLLESPDDQNPFVTLLTPEPALLVASFKPSSWAVSGIVKNDYDQVPLAGVKVTFLSEATGQSIKIVTGSDGLFNPGRLEVGTYTMTIEHSCFTTWTETFSVTGDMFLDRPMWRQISANATKRKLQIGETSDLTPSYCADAIQYSWYIDQSGAEEKFSTNRDVTVSFGIAGWKPVRLIMKFANNEEATFYHQAFFDVVPCLPGKPALQVSAENKASNGTVQDYCPDGLGKENVAFSADLLLGQCASGSATSYAWKLNGVSAGSGQAITLAITESPKTQKVQVTATRDGKSYVGGKDLILTECQAPKDVPILSTRELNLTNKVVNGTTTTWETVKDINIPDDDGKTTVKGDAVLNPKCGTCKHEITFEKWVLTWKDDKKKTQTRTILGEDTEILLDQGFREYNLTGYATTKDIQPGKVRDLKPVSTPTRLIRVTMKIPLPLLGTCRNAPFYCQEFYSDAMKTSALDVRKTTATLASQGVGLSGQRDDGIFSFVTADGPFTLVARVKTLPATAEAGIMIRNGLLVSDRSLFLARKGTEALVTYRERFNNDAIPYNLAVADNCLRIARTSTGLITLHTANATTCPNPEDANAWGAAKGTGQSVDYSQWPGRIYLGIAAGGGTSNVDFDNIYLKAGEVLTDPSLIINTVFADGNLVSNWSFENPLETFTKAGGINLRTTGTPYTGRFFARVVNKAAGQEVGTKDKLLLRVTNRDQKAIGLKIQFRYRRNASFSAPPSLVFSNKDGVLSSPYVLPNPFTNNFTDWQAYEAVVYYRDVSGIQNQEYFQLHLVDKNIALSTSQQLDFDDVVVAPIFQNIQVQSKPVTNLTFADGLNQPFQDVKLGTTEDIVSARVLDDEGRPMRTLPIFGGKMNDPASEFHKVRKDPVASAMAYFNDASSDPLRRKGDNVIDFKPKWSDFRTDVGRVDIEASPLNRALMTYGRSSGQEQDFSYAYSASSDLTQSIKTTTLGSMNLSRLSKEYQNAFGYVVRTEAYNSSADVAMATTHQKDILGRAWGTTVPGFAGTVGDGTPAFTRSAVYNTLDQSISSNDADAGATESLYDKRGLLRFFRDAQKIADGEFVAKVYDKLGRQTHVFTVKDPTMFTQDAADLTTFPIGNVNSTLKIQSLYDKAPANLPSGIMATEMTNLRGQQSGVTAYTSRGEASTFYSYDERGNLKTEWKATLNLPVHRSDLTYNMEGKVVRKAVIGTRPDGSTLSKTQEFAFDEFDRLRIIRDVPPGAAPTDIARYEYWPDGKVRYLDFGSGLAQGMSYQYDQSERVVRMQHEKREVRSDNPDIPLYYPTNYFEQRLAYDFFGNVASQNYRYGGAADSYRGTKYTYDDFNRLVDATHGEGSTSYDAINYAADARLNSNLEYFEDGTIKGAVRGKANVATSSDYAQYQYYKGTHRLRRISGEVTPGGYTRDQADNYVYDANGNVRIDRGTKRIFEYDFRNLPVKVTQCRSMSGDGCLETGEILEMVYDADGKRVAKFKVN